MYLLKENFNGKKKALGWKWGKNQYILEMKDKKDLKLQ